MARTKRSRRTKRRAPRKRTSRRSRRGSPRKRTSRRSRRRTSPRKSRRLITLEKKIKRYRQLKVPIPVDMQVEYDMLRGRQTRRTKWTREKRRQTRRTRRTRRRSPTKRTKRTRRTGGARSKRLPRSSLLYPKPNDPDLETTLRQTEEYIEGIPPDERRYIERRLKEMEDGYISDDDEFLSADEGDDLCPDCGVGYDV